jgi:uncharacterized protein YifN (PemK superfamily)
MDQTPVQPLARPGRSFSAPRRREERFVLYPKKKEILCCLFEEADSTSDAPLRGFIVPEMIKKRPVIVLSTVSQGLAIVVPLSTTPPVPVKSFHYELVWDSPLPGWDAPSCWAKGDMVYTVSNERLRPLNLWYDHRRKRNETIQKFLSSEQWEGVRRAVRDGLKL